jgi:hypothetical protein
VSNDGVFSSREALVVAALIAAVVGSRALGAQTTNRLEGGRLTIAVVDRHSALALAFEEVSRFCGCVVDYEGPEWAWRGDLETAQGAPGKASSVARRTTLRLTAPVSDPLTRPETRRVVAELVSQFARQTSARFEIRDTWPLEVVPTQWRAADGSVRRPRPLMDTPISVSGPPARPAVWLQRIAAALGAAAHREVDMLLRGNQVSFGAVMAFEARDEPASAVFRRLYASARPDAGWGLEYSPPLGKFILALRTPRPRHLSVIDPDPPGGAPER